MIFAVQIFIHLHEKNIPFSYFENRVSNLSGLQQESANFMSRRLLILLKENHNYVFHQRRLILVSLS